MNETFDDLRPHLLDYLHSRGINPRRRFRCLNPDHLDRDPSMGYDSRRCKVHCFACGADYDLFRPAADRRAPIHPRGVPRRPPPSCRIPSGNVQLKPVAAVKLERYVVVSGGAGVHAAVVIAVVVHIGILPLGDNSRLHRQARRVVVLVPGAKCPSTAKATSRR